MACRETMCRAGSAYHMKRQAGVDPFNESAPCIHPLSSPMLQLPTSQLDRAFVLRANELHLSKRHSPFLSRSKPETTFGQPSMAPRRASSRDECKISLVSCTTESAIQCSLQSREWCRYTTTVSQRCSLHKDGCSHQLFAAG